MVNQMDRLVFSVVLQPMKIELGLNDTALGVLQTVFILSIALLAFPVSYLVDRWSRRKSISLMALIWSAFTFVTGLATNFWGVLFPRTLVGVGEAAFAPGGVAMITAAYPKEKRGKVAGVFVLAMSLGTALGVVLGGYLSAKFGWRTPFYIFAIPGIMLAIAAFFMRDYKTAQTDNGPVGNNFFRSILELLKIKTFIWYLLGYAMFQVVTQPVLAWAPAYVMRAENVTEDKAGMIVAAIVVMSIIAAPLGGFIADWWQKKNARARMLFPAICSALCTVFMAGALALKLENLGFVLALLFGVFNVIGLPAMGIVSQEVVKPHQKSLSFGVTTFAMYLLGGAWAPAVVGAISDSLGGGATGLQIALLISCSGGLLGGLFLWIGSRYFVADSEKVKGLILEAEK